MEDGPLNRFLLLDRIPLCSFYETTMAHVVCRLGSLFCVSQGNDSLFPERGWMMGVGGGLGTAAVSLSVRFPAATLSPTILLLLV